MKDSAACSDSQQQMRIGLSSAKQLAAMASRLQVLR